MKIANFFANILEKIDGMSNSTKIFALVIAAMFVAGWVYIEHGEQEKEVELARINSTIYQDRSLQDSESIRKAIDYLGMKNLDQFRNEGENLVNSFAKNTPLDHVEVIQINGKKIANTELTAIRDQDKEQAVKIENVSEPFLIYKLDGNDPLQMKVTAVSERRKGRAVLSAPRLNEDDLFIDDDVTDALDDSEIDLLWKALKNKKPIKLAVKLELNIEGKITGGQILKVFEMDR